MPTMTRQLQPNRARRCRVARCCPALLCTALLCTALLCATFALMRPAAAMPPQLSGRPPQAREPAPSPPLLLLQPLRPAPDSAAIEAVRGALVAFYGLDVRVLPAAKMPAAAWTSPRRRWRADVLLDWLQPRALAVQHPGRVRILAVTAADISTTKGSVADWGVLGLATLDGHAGVISTFSAGRGVRRATMRERLAKTAVHEVGHSFGLTHCPSPGCLLQDALGKVATTDGEDDLCPRCRAALAGIRVHVPAFAPAERGASTWLQRHTPRQR